MKVLHGLTVSQGIAIGHIWKKEQCAPQRFEHYASEPLRELEKLGRARQKALERLEAMRKKAETEVDAQSAEIFEAHQSFLEDDCFFETVESEIREQGISAAWAVEKTGNGFAKAVGRAADEYLAERAADIEDIIQTLIGILTGQDGQSFRDLPEHTILVAKELTPSDTMNLDIHKVDAFVTETGGKNSHVAIIARAAGKVALIGAEGVCELAENGETAAVDGASAEICLSPDEKTLLLYEGKRKLEFDKKTELAALIGRRTATPDGRGVELLANIATPEDVRLALENDAEGVGLFRTEFVYIDRSDYPSEEEQFERYRDAAEAMKKRPLVIRTMDIGGDKGVPYFGIAKEDNPFLGYRAIRICLDRPELFKTQLRAILRASAFGDVRVMFPMVSGLEELSQAKQLLREAKGELEAKGVPYNRDIPCGTMVEVPSAAILADLIAEECDFFSIGTNDLTQYTLAADRGNERVARLYSPFHPAVLRLIQNIVTCAHLRGKKVGMCGEAAADPRLLPVLIGMELDEISVAPAAILSCRDVICRTPFRKMRGLAGEVLCLRTTAEVEAALERETQAKAVHSDTVKFHG